MKHTRRSSAGRTNIVLDSKLVASSVWIAYLRGDNRVEVEGLAAALEHGEPVWLAPPILILGAMPATAS